jgi:FMN-dependent NADH-azoreductase
MSTLLHIDSSARSERSVSRQLTHDFATAWQQAHPGGKIIYRDLGHNHVPLMSENFIAAAHTPSEALSPQQREALAISNELIGELETANEYVFGVPMYNFSVPAAFKAYIDQIVRVGRTFAVDESGYKGWYSEKRLPSLPVVAASTDPAHQPIPIISRSHGFDRFSVLSE